MPALPPLAPFFQRIKVIAAILRASVRRAIGYSTVEITNGRGRMRGLNDLISTCY